MIEIRSKLTGAGSIRRILLCGAAIAAMANIPANVHAQTVQGTDGSGAGQASTEAPTADEIVVTAFKRAEALQDVPAAITAIGGAEIRSAAIGDLQELSRDVPNVRIQQGAEDTFIFIRGAGSGINEGFEQSVGLFIDGIYLGRGRQFLAPFLDVERVEFLKGPQGVVLGKNTIAGAINVTTARPTAEFEAAASAAYETEVDGRSLEGFVSGPITPGLRARLSGKVAQSDGFLRNTASGGREVGERTWLLRGSVEADLTDRLSLFAKVEGGAFNQKGVNSQVSAFGPGASFLGLMTPTTVDPAFTANIADDRKSMLTFSNLALFTGRTGPGRYDRERDDTSNFNAAATIDYDLASATITSVTGYSWFEMNRVFDADYGALPFIVVDTPSGRFHQFSQELRVLSSGQRKFDYLIGAYYQHQNFDVKRNEHVVGSVLGAADFSTWRQFNQTAESLAAFGQLTWNFAENARARGGLRYTHESKRAAVAYSIIPFLDQSPAHALTGLTPETLTAAGFGLGASARSARRSVDDLSPSASIEADILADSLVYVSFARGFKSGGFSEQVSSPASTCEFDDERAQTFELGAKFKLLDGRLRANVALFSTRYTNLQVTAFDGLLFDVGNAAKSRARGLEADLAWQVSRELQVGGSAAYLDSKFVSFPDGPNLAGAPGVQDLGGRPTLFAPEWTLNAFVEGKADLGGAEVHGRVDLGYVDRQFFQLDLDPQDSERGYATLDARLGLRLLDGSLDVALVGKNLTNVRAKIYSFDVPAFSGSHGAIVNRPRTMTVQISAQF